MHLPNNPEDYLETGPDNPSYEDSGEEPPSDSEEPNDPLPLSSLEPDPRTRTRKEAKTMRVWPSGGNPSH